ncbi:hypothetical protein [Paraliomyxa miuraensis]|uniref:hypothetical protein n=1 Tax=Paraliomyxa miuraensis TaxID=376150 RepID=UPI00225932A5|nr:hypothetical protein [Paraliomyxa miuraensis]MCX4246933.1 hypothetical protein [Paraliomyxa miuraensis]
MAHARLDAAPAQAPLQADDESSAVTPNDDPAEANAGAPVELQAKRPRWTLQIDPLTTALGYVHLQVERALGDHASIYFGPSLRLFNGLLDLDATSSYRGYGVELGARWFIRGGAPKGWWVMARGVLAYLRADSGVTNVGGYVSALGGYTGILRGWFVLSGGLGVQYIHYTVDGLGTRTFFPAAHTALGVAF